MSTILIDNEAHLVRIEDLDGLYELLSRVLLLKVNRSEYGIALKKPEWQSRSSGAHMVVCEINGERRVVFKRCYDNPDFIRREIMISEAKKMLHLPMYGLEYVNGLKLRSPATGRNSSLIEGWDDKNFIAIDFGQRNEMRNLKDLDVTYIKDMDRFLYSYGKWCSFNYLLGVRDRHGGNFVFSVDKQELHSVDNEEGPFDSSGRFIGVDDILVTMKQNIGRFIEGPDRLHRVQEIKRGFITCWREMGVLKNSSLKFNDNERKLFESLISNNSESVAALLV